MSASLKKVLLMFLVVVLLAGVGSVPSSRAVDAYATAYLFAHCVNYRYRDSGLIYDLLPAHEQSRIGRDDFIAAFEKERSYPYLTPLFFNLESVTLTAADGSAEARYSQAARLPGMYTTVIMPYDGKRFSVSAFGYLIDGSYLKKFER